MKYIILISLVFIMSCGPEIQGRKPIIESDSDTISEPIETDSKTVEEPATESQSEDTDTTIYKHQWKCLICK